MKMVFVHIYHYPLYAVRAVTDDNIYGAELGHAYPITTSEGASCLALKLLDFRGYSTSKRTCIVFKNEN